MTTPAVPFRGKDVVLVMPSGIKVDVKSSDLDVTLKEEQYYPVGGGGYPKGYLVATSEAMSFAGVAMDDGENCPIPDTYFGTGGEITTFEGLDLLVTWRDGETWIYKVNVTSVRFGILGDALASMSGQMSIVGRPFRNSSSST